MQTPENSPTLKVILAFALLGALLGAFFTCVIEFIFAVIEILRIGDNLHVRNFMFFPIFFIILSIIATVPATLTGVFLGYKRFVICGTSDYLKLFLTACVITLPCILLTTLTPLNRFESLNFKFVLELLVSSGLSAVIIGKFTLPKT